MSICFASLPCDDIEYVHNVYYMALVVLLAGDGTHTRYLRYS